MVWGAMSYHGNEILKYVKGTLNSVGYIDILTNCTIPSAHPLRYGDDGAPCHRAKFVKEQDWHTTLMVFDDWKIRLLSHQTLTQLKISLRHM